MRAILGRYDTTRQGVLPVFSRTCVILFPRLNPGTGQPFLDESHRNSRLVLEALGTQFVFDFRPESARLQVPEEASLSQKVTETTWDACRSFLEKLWELPESDLLPK